MSSYLRFFELERSPFDGGGQTQVVLGTRAVRDAFGAIRAGIEAGDSRICVSGEAGMGKTSLARALPKLLGEAARVAVVPDPTIGWAAARPAIARQWGVEDGGLARPALLAIRSDRPLVLVIDQAECADDDFLDHLDVLLCYRTPDDRPVVQSVLMARLSNQEGEAAATPLHWWLDRIHTLQLEFAPLPLDGVAPYIEKHLRRAGWRGALLFDDAAAAAIHGYTGGVPGAISDLCERLLIEAAGRSLGAIDAAFVETFCDAPPTAHEAAEANDLTDETAADDAGDPEAAEQEPAFDGAQPSEPTHTVAASDAFEEASDPALEAALAEALAATLAEDDEAVALDLVDVAQEADEATAPEAATSDIDLEAALEYFEEATADPTDGDAVEAADATDEDATESEVESDREEAEIEMESDVEVDAAFAGPSPWACAGADDALLLSPPSEDEMRALRGSALQRFARPLLGALAAIVIGGIGLALLSPDEDPPTTASKRPATMLPDRASNPTAENTVAAPRALADYARDRDGIGDDSRVIFAPGAGFVRAERGEGEAAQLAATKDSAPTTVEATRDMKEAPATAPARERPRAATGTPALVLAPLEAEPSAGEREVLDLTPSEATDAPPTEIAAVDDNDTTIVVPGSSSRGIRATPESAPTSGEAASTAPAAPSPLADGNR